MAAKKEADKPSEDGKTRTFEERKGRVDIGNISATGERFKAAFENELKQQLRALELCYQKALEKESDLKGAVTLKLTIDSKGKVSKVSLVSSQLKNKRLEKCILEGIKELSFPVPEGKKEVTVNLSFNFKLS